MDSTPWYDSQIFAVVLGAILPSAFAILTGFRKRIQERRTTSELEKANDKIAELQEAVGKYNAVKTKLRESAVIVDYEQPVLLLGPRFVGKSSLMTQWHAPWVRSSVRQTVTHQQSSVPVYDFVKPGLEPHFADRDVLTEVHAHLKLLVHDFPGELSAQQSIIDRAKKETERLESRFRLNLGVVLVCMFDAEEAATGISDDTRDYYNGELFASLDELVSRRNVRVERLIIVFNKFDLLRKRKPGTPDAELLSLCSVAFHRSFRHFHGICNPERMCEAIAVLDRDTLDACQGATFVRGEAARALVATVVGAAEAERQFGPPPSPPVGASSRLP